MSNKNGVTVISTGSALESFRDSDFDCYSAYGEVIDNSVQAHAKNIRIKFDPKGAEDIDRIVFSDDGDGMDFNILQMCIRLGYSSRFNDRGGIGRFGVGMTQGAIHECRRIDIYSKTTDGDWQYTYMDMDEIKSHSDSTKNTNTDDEWRIPPPIKKHPSDSNIDNSYIPNNSGTIVIWSKYDRLNDKRQSVISEFKIYAGRTYRYYMWDLEPTSEKPIRPDDGPLSIYIDGKKIDVIDPLYFRVEQTAFPDDPKAKKYDPITIEYPIKDPEIVQKIGKKTSVITINLSLLPLEFRKEAGSGGAKETKDRFIDRNEGISFLRHGREVGYDWIPHWGFSADDKDRWWGCEICFEPELDRSFTVKNIKRGAVPSTDLKKLIGDRLKPFIRQRRLEISDDWRPTNKPKEKEPQGGGGHGLAEAIAGKTPLPKGKIVKAGDQEAAADIAAGIAADGNPAEKLIWEERFKAQPFTIKDHSWPGTSFLDINHMGGSDFLMYNTRHLLFDVLTTIREEIKDGINLEGNSDRLIALTDIIFMAYGKAISMIDADEKMPAIQFKDELVNNWGSYLSAYIKSWQTQIDEDLK
jgi:hypothetical protein